ncbi:MAG: S8 family serine peptidase [Chloroflexota bacterium]|mgnify:CR=1 FL=1
MKGLGSLTRFRTTALAVAFVVSSLGAAGTSPTSSFRAAIDPSLRAGEVALVHTTAGRAGALSLKLADLGAVDIETAYAADTVIARLSSDALAAIATDPTVTVAARNIGVIALDGGRDLEEEDGGAAAPDSAGVNAINGPRAWRESTGKGVAVALMDSGIARHTDLPRDTVIARVNFVNDGATSLDPAGHGTHIAGLIAADGARFKGVAPDAKLVSLRMLDANGRGEFRSVVRAFDWVLKYGSRNNIKVLNLSWGAPQSNSYHSDLLSAMVESVWFRGIAVVAAAGNGGAAGTITTPGSDPFIITVGSFDDMGTAAFGDDRRSSFSSQGPTRDGFTKPDVLAPGRHVKSLRAAYSEDDRYIRMTGTSASAGFVSGVAALVASEHESYSPTKIKGAIVGGARRVSGSATPAVDAARSLDAMTTVNAGLAPSRLLLSFLASSGVKLKGHGVTWEGVTSFLANSGVKLKGHGVTWEGVTWEGVTWEGVTWEGVTWETVTWETVSWESVSWETVTWEGVAWEKVANE